MVRLAAAVACLAAALPASAAAQAGAIAGLVLDAVDETPVKDALVSVEGTRRSTRTGEDGRFRLAPLAVGLVNVRIEAPGYAGLVSTVNVAAEGDTPLTARLDRFAGILEGLLVDVEQDRRRGEAVARIDSTGLEAEIPGAKRPQEVLEGRIPGALVMRAGSQPGSGYQILLRGLNTLSGSGAPMIYVDGVRLSGPQAGSIMGIRPRQSLDFIDPESIERIEVVRGPAAQLAFGMDAAGGVILIFTKQGRRPRHDPPVPRGALP